MIINRRNILGKIIGFDKIQKNVLYVKEINNSPLFTYVENKVKSLFIFLSFIFIYVLGYFENNNLIKLLGIFLILVNVIVFLIYFFKYESHTFYVKNLGELKRGDLISVDEIVQINKIN